METGERFAAARRIFLAAGEREGEELTTYLARECAGDAELAAEVRALLAEERALDPRLDRPALPSATTSPLFSQTGGLDEALALELAVVAERERRIGLAHPDSRASLNNLAEVFRGLERPADEEPGAASSRPSRKPWVPTPWSPATRARSWRSSSSAPGEQRKPRRSLPPGERRPQNFQRNSRRTAA